MTPKAQRIAIAEFVGYSRMECCGGVVFPDETWVDRAVSYEVALALRAPDYLNSLDAMHEAEAKLSEKQLEDMDKILWLKIVDSGHYVWRATAAQRAEALLKAIGKWTDADPELAGVMKFGGVSK